MDGHHRPREFLAHRPYYELPLLYRPRAYEATDTPVEAIYRIYEHILLDQNVNMRNELERFWYHNGTYGSSVWPVRDIPDPKDPDPERYACVAAVPRLLREAFNERIRLGLPRDAPSIFTGEMMDEWKARGTLEREQDPPWVDKVPRLSKELKIPYWDERSDAWLYPVSAEDKGLSPAFLDKNVLIVHPDIHFL